MAIADRLQNQLVQPSGELIEDLRTLHGDLIVLGAGGKLGPSLVELAVRGIAAASTEARVHAVSRFSDDRIADALAEVGANVIKADLTDDAALAALPDAPNVIYLVGAKFGTSGHEPATWACNAYLSGRVAARYAGHRIVGLSTANVYPLTPIASSGAVEATMVGPVGEYAMSCLGRERIFEHFMQRSGGSLALIRLAYAVEMRYGLLVDLAKAIRAGEEIDLTTGHANIVWQGYANEVIIRSLRHAANPAFTLNVTGPEILAIRKTADALATAMGTTAQFTGTEAATALLTDASRCHGLFGYPTVAVATLIEATAEWVSTERETLDKPTKFQRRDGRF